MLHLDVMCDDRRAPRPTALARGAVREYAARGVGSSPGDCCGLCCEALSCREDRMSSAPQSTAAFVNEAGLHRVAAPASLPSAEPETEVEVQPLATGDNDDDHANQVDRLVPVPRQHKRRATTTLEITPPVAADPVSVDVEVEDVKATDIHNKPANGPAAIVKLLHTIDAFPSNVLVVDPTGGDDQGTPNNACTQDNAVHLHKSAQGGACTILSAFIVVWTLLAGFSELMSEEPAIAISRHAVADMNISTAIAPKFAVSIDCAGETPLCASRRDNISKDDRYLRVEFAHREIFDGYRDDSRPAVSVDVATQPCDVDGTASVCPADEELTLQGDFGDDTYAFIQVTISPCPLYLDEISDSLIDKGLDPDTYCLVNETNMERFLLDSNLHISFVRDSRIPTPLAGKLLYRLLTTPDLRGFRSGSKTRCSGTPRAGLVSIEIPCWAKTCASSNTSRLFTLNIARASCSMVSTSTTLLWLTASNAIKSTPCGKCDFT